MPAIADCTERGTMRLRLYGSLDGSLGIDLLEAQYRFAAIDFTAALTGTVDPTLRLIRGDVWKRIRPALAERGPWIFDGDLGYSAPTEASTMLRVPPPIWGGSAASAFTVTCGASMVTHRV